MPTVGRVTDLDALLSDSTQISECAAGGERLCRWVLENAPEYAAKVDKVWLWDDWPGGEGRRDSGIDLGRPGSRRRGTGGTTRRAAVGVTMSFSSDGRG